jgi:hypothetical protein
MSSHLKRFPSRTRSCCYCCCIFSWSSMLGLRSSSDSKPSLSPLFCTNVSVRHFDFLSGLTAFIDHLGSNKHSITMPTTSRTPSAAPTTNGSTNGHTSVDIDDRTTVHDTINEMNIVQKKRRTESHASHTGTRSISRSSHAHTFTNDQHVTVLRQTVITTRTRLISELSHVDAHYIDSMTVESFLKFTERQRLMHMPRRGSRWDRVLTRAEYFALQISRYEKQIHSFVPDSRNAARMIWAAARVLIEVSL